MKVQAGGAGGVVGSQGEEERPLCYALYVYLLLTKATVPDEELNFRDVPELDQGHRADKPGFTPESDWLHFLPGQSRSTDLCSAGMHSNPLT